MQCNGMWNVKNWKRIVWSSNFTLLENLWDFKCWFKREAESIPVAPGEEGDGFVGDSKTFLQIHQLHQPYKW